MTGRRYENGRPIDEKRASTPKVGWGPKADETVVAMPLAPAETPYATAPSVSWTEKDKPTVAKIVRRPPPVLSAPVPPPEPAVDAMPPPAMPPTVPVIDEPILDTSDMRKFLLAQMVRAAKGEITTETVKNIVTLSQQVYNATSLELKAAAILKDSERSIRALELVSPQNGNG